MINISPYLLKTWLQTYVMYEDRDILCRIEDKLFKHFGSIEAACEQNKLNKDNNLVEK